MTSNEVRHNQGSNLLHPFAGAISASIDMALPVHSSTDPIRPSIILHHCSVAQQKVLVDCIQRLESRKILVRRTMKEVLGTLEQILNSQECGFQG